MYLKKEIKDKIQKISKDRNDTVKQEESFFDNCIADFMDYFERQKSAKLLKRDDYKNLLDKMENIKNKYPKARAFIEDEKINNFTNDELKAILEIIELNDEIETLEIEEAFKLGLKEQSML